MKAQRETILIIGLILALMLFTAVAAVFQARQNENPPLSSTSNLPDGARALRLWLSAAGYQVDSQSGQTFAIPPDAAAVLILHPSLNFGISPEEWVTLADWVRHGGILLLAAGRWDISFSGNPFKLITSEADPKEYDIFPPVPIFRSPPMAQPAHLFIDRIVNYDGTGGRVLLAIASGPVAWQIHLGQGQLLVITDDSFLTNSGLKNTGNAALAMNLISQIPVGSKIFMDEFHHGVSVDNSSGVGPMAWLTQTSAGFAVLFAAGLIFLGLVLAGRPFGKRVPLANSHTRRGTLDYVIALANLNRRAGHRRSVIEYYYGELKRALGKRYQLDPGQPDPDFVARLTQINPALESAGLIELIRRLSQRRYSENDMVRLARECADWIEKIEH